MNVFSIIIPAYNEEESIKNTIETAIIAKEKIIECTAVDEVEIIIINDGSTDNTADIVSSYKEVRLINHETNLGYGVALKTGFANAKGEILGFHDADGTCYTERFIDLLSPILNDGVDLVVGRRTGPGTQMPLIRNIGNRFFAAILSFLGRTEVKDTASGMRVFTTKTLEKLHPLPDGLHFTPVMSAKAIFEGLRIVEVPIPYAERQGKSKLNAIKDGLRFLFSILGVVKIYNPLKLFGIVGFLFIFVALLYSIDPVIHYVIYGRVGEGVIYRLLTVSFLGITGILIILFGITSNLIVEILRGGITKQTKIEKIFCHPRITKNFFWIGLFLLLIGSLLIVPSLVQYIYTRTISYNWAYFVLSMFLLTLGIQFILMRYLVTIVQDLIKFKILKK
jgi:glycosyltransferase involved in cell wall biosynthesis